MPLLTAARASYLQYRKYDEEAIDRFDVLGEVVSEPREAAELKDTAFVLACGLAHSRLQRG